MYGLRDRVRRDVFVGDEAQATRGLRLRRTELDRHETTVGVEGGDRARRAQVVGEEARGALVHLRILIGVEPILVLPRTLDGLSRAIGPLQPSKTIKVVYEFRLGHLV